MDAPDGLTRRHALGGLAAAGLSLPLLAACGDGGAPSGAPPSAAPEVPPRSAGTVVPITVADVPVGSGVIVAASEVVITQPSAGKFKAFSSICTHMGCPVTTIDKAVIGCPCHGSTFSIRDGSVLGGPAPAPLPAKTVTVSGNQITVS